MAVVIPTLNGGMLFRRLLEQLLAQDCAAEMDIIVVDSGSRDGTVEAALRAGARVLHERGRFNHGRTRQCAASHIRAPLTFFLTQDAIPASPGALSRLASALESTPPAAGAWGRQIPRPDDKPLTRARLLRDGAKVRVIRQLPPGQRLDRLSPLQQFELTRFDNVFSCIRTELLQGPLPLPSAIFGEDIAWARNAIAAGYALVHEPAACVEHSHERGLSYEFRRHYVDGRTLNQLYKLPPPGVAKALGAAAAATLRDWTGLARQGGVSPHTFLAAAAAPLVEAAGQAGLALGAGDERNGRPWYLGL
ncbi:MAG: hypothetical protein GMKNLPBB_02481 [Myxococcota bacterium]|nr:hypothetical protein [Myxococcota bacterium]